METEKIVAKSTDFSSSL